MHRIFKRIVSLTALAFIAGACVAACATEEPTYDFAKNKKAFDEGGCAPEFCPEVPGGGAPCCVPGTSICGMDKGMGCQAPTAPDAGS